MIPIVSISVSLECIYVPTNIAKKLLTILCEHYFDVFTLSLQWFFLFPCKNISVRKDHIMCILYTVSKINGAEYATIYTIERNQEQFYDTVGG